MIFPPLVFWFVFPPRRFAAFLMVTQLNVLPSLPRLAGVFLLCSFLRCVCGHVLLCVLPIFFLYDRVPRLVSFTFVPPCLVVSPFCIFFSPIFFWFVPSFPGSFAGIGPACVDSLFSSFFFTRNVFSFFSPFYTFFFVAF